MSDSQQFDCNDCGYEDGIEMKYEVSNGDRVCNRCIDNYFECTHCKQHAARSNRQSGEDGKDICERCASLYYTYSDLQECYISDDRTVTLRDTDQVVSISWADENAHQDSDGNYFQHEDNVPGRKLHDHDEDVLNWCDYDKEILSRGALVFGVELEMEPARNSSQDNLVEALGGRTTDSYILKDDASLEWGVELVCIPLTLEQHRTSFGWEEVLSPVQNIAKRRARNCGQHVHINKAALTPFQIGKMLVFLNSSIMRDRITAVAQRESNDYCRRSEKKVTDGGAVSESRYDIVNVGESTVEVRMFQGTIRADLVLKNIEFCHALVMFCRDASLNSVEQWDKFASWLVKRRGQYPNLVKFLAEEGEDGFRGLVRPRKIEQKGAVACA